MTDLNQGQVQRQSSQKQGNNHPAGRHTEQIPHQMMHQQQHFQRIPHSMQQPMHYGMQNNNYRFPIQKKNRNRPALSHRPTYWACWPQSYNINQRNNNKYERAFKKGNYIEFEYNPIKTSHLAYYCNKLQNCLEAHNRNPLNRQAPLLKKFKEPDSKNTAWDFLLLEMQWVATERIQNLKFRKAQLAQIAPDIRNYAPKFRINDKCQNISEKIVVCQRLSAFNSIITAISEINRNDHIAKEFIKKTGMKPSLINFLKKMISTHRVGDVVQNRFSSNLEKKIIQKTIALDCELDLFLNPTQNVIRSTYSISQMIKKDKENAPKQDEKATYHLDIFMRRFRKRFQQLKIIQITGIGKKGDALVEQDNSSLLTKRTISKTQFDSTIPNQFRIMTPLIMQNNKEESTKKVSQLADKYEITKDALFYNRYRFLQQSEFLQNALQYAQDCKISIQSPQNQQKFLQRRIFDLMPLEYFPLRLLPLHYQRSSVNHFISKQDIKQELSKFGLQNIQCYQFNLLRKRDHFRQIKAFQADETKEMNSILPNLNTKTFNQLSKKLRSLLRITTQGIDHFQTSQSTQNNKTHHHSAIQSSKSLQKKSQFSKSNSNKVQQTCMSSQKQNEQDMQQKDKIKQKQVEQKKKQQTQQNEKQQNDESKFKQAKQQQILQLGGSKILPLHLFQTSLLEWAVAIYGSRWHIIQNLITIHPLSSSLPRNPVSNYQKILSKKNKNNQFNIDPTPQVPCQHPKLSDSLPIIMSHRHLPNTGQSTFLKMINYIKREKVKSTQRNNDILKELEKESCLQLNKRNMKEIEMEKSKVVKWKELPKQERIKEFRSQFKNLIIQLANPIVGQQQQSRQSSETVKAKNDYHIAIDIQNKELVQKSQTYLQTRKFTELFTDIQLSNSVKQCKHVRRKKYQRMIETQGSSAQLALDSFQVKKGSVSIQKLAQKKRKRINIQNPLKNPSLFVLKTPYLNLSQKYIPRFPNNHVAKKKRRQLFGPKGMCNLLAENTKIYTIANNIKDKPEISFRSQCRDYMKKLSGDKTQTPRITRKKMSQIDLISKHELFQKNNNVSNDEEQKNFQSNEASIDEGQDFFDNRINQIEPNQSQAEISSLNNLLSKDLDIWLYKSIKEQQTINITPPLSTSKNNNHSVTTTTQREEPLQMRILLHRRLDVEKQIRNFYRLRQCIFCKLRNYFTRKQDYMSLVGKKYGNKWIERLSIQLPLELNRYLRQPYGNNKSKKSVVINQQQRARFKNNLGRQQDRRDCLPELVKNDGDYVVANGDVRKNERNLVMEVQVTQTTMQNGQYRHREDGKKEEVSDDDKDEEEYDDDDDEESEARFQDNSSQDFDSDQNERYRHVNKPRTGNKKVTEMGLEN